MTKLALKRPIFILAPMDDVTDTVFRQMVAKLRPPDIFFTEFVNVDGLMSPGRSALLSKLRFSPNERPLIAQLWGKQPANFYKVASQIASGQLAKELGERDGLNFAGVDLNMGCPQKSIVANGTCSALMNNRPLAKDIIEATRQGLKGRLALSIKTRTGYLEPDMAWIEFLLKCQLDMLTIHGRTKKQMSQVPADWTFIGEASKRRDQLAPDTLIIGNGDILSRQQGLELIKKYKLDGVMIGRGIFNDPFVFDKDSLWPVYSRLDKIRLYKRHIELFNRTWSNSDKPVYGLNKFCKVYISGFNDAKQLRQQLMAAGSTSQLLKIINSQLRQPADSSVG